MCFKHLLPSKIFTRNFIKLFVCLLYAEPMPCIMFFFSNWLRSKLFYFGRGNFWEYYKGFLKIKTFSKWILFHYFSSSVNSYIWNNTISFNFLIFTRHKVLCVPKKLFPDIVSLD